MHFFVLSYCVNEKSRICTVFFMVLDLRLMKDWLSR